MLSAPESRRHGEGRSWRLGLRKGLWRTFPVLSSSILKPSALSRLDPRTTAAPLCHDPHRYGKYALDTSRTAHPPSIITSGTRLEAFFPGLAENMTAGCIRNVPFDRRQVRKSSVTDTRSDCAPCGDDAYAAHSGVELLRRQHLRVLEVLLGYAAEKAWAPLPFFALGFAVPAVIDRGGRDRICR